MTRLGAFLPVTVVAAVFHSFAIAGAQDNASPAAGNGSDSSTAQATAASTPDSAPQPGASSAAAEPASSAAPAPVAESRGILAKLSVHGFLTQAYAISDQEAEVLGITDKGTADYRAAAVQFRYDFDPQNMIVIQFDHERVGDSALSNVRDDVGLNWAFYQHRFSDSTSVKVGRMPLPAGIYNEYRNVGMLLPFYRPNPEFYPEVAFSNEIVDGVALSRSMGTDSGWGLDVDAFYGGWTQLEPNLMGGYSAAQSKNALGVRVWLNTPVEGVRIAGTALRYDVRGGDNRGPDIKTKFHELLGAIEANFERFGLRGELRFMSIDDGQYNVAYVEPWLRLTDKLKLVGQASMFDLRDLAPIGTNFIVPDIDTDDLALGLNYAFRPEVALKLEGHARRTTTQTPIGEVETNTKYTILSLSTSF